MATHKDKPKAGVDYLPAGEIYEKVLEESGDAGDSYDKDPDGYLVRLTDRFANAYRELAANLQEDLASTEDSTNRDQTPD